jgi:hypothetical protein
LPFAGTVALTHYYCVTTPYRYPNLRRINGGEGTSDLARLEALGLDRLTVPAVKAEDPVGLGHRVPAFDEGEFLA